MKNSAKYQISSSVNEDIFEIAVKGEVKKNTFEEVVHDVNMIIKANNLKKTLADFRAVSKRLDPSKMYRYFREHDVFLLNTQKSTFRKAFNTRLPQSMQV